MQVAARICCGLLHTLPMVAKTHYSTMLARDCWGTPHFALFTHSQLLVIVTFHGICHCQRLSVSPTLRTMSLTCQPLSCTFIMHHVTHLSGPTLCRIHITSHCQPIVTDSGMPLWHPGSSPEVGPLSSHRASYLTLPYLTLPYLVRRLKCAFVVRLVFTHNAPTRRWFSN